MCVVCVCGVVARLSEPVDSGVRCRRRRSDDHLPEFVDRAAVAPADGNCGKRAVQAPVVEHTSPPAFPNNAVPGIKGDA